MQVGSYEASQREKARELRAKFYPKKMPVQAKVIIDIPAFLPVRPEWKSNEIYFDAHMMDWRREIEGIHSPLKAYIRRRANEMGYSYQDVVKSGVRGTAVLSKARYLLMWEVKRIVKPHITWQELGNVFGGFNHATCLYGVKMFDKIKAERLAGEKLDD